LRSGIRARQRDFADGEGAGNDAELPPAASTSAGPEENEG
jgi:hypothetical protein